MTNTDVRVKKYLLFYSAAAALVFFAAMYIYSGFDLSAPLDDAFIYFQYAKNTAAGHFMEYVSGQGYSSGATSFLYALILTPFALFLKGSSIILITYITGAVSLFFSGFYLYKSAESLTGKKELGFFAAALFVTNGNILWGYFSGMEIGLFGMLLIMTFFFLETDPVSPAAIVSMTFLALIRPEGYAVVAAVILLKIFFWLASGRKGRIVWYAVPLIIGLTGFVINRIFTGDFMPNTMRAKSNFSLYYFDYTEIISQGFGLFMKFISDIFNGGNEHYYPVYSFFVFLAAVLPGIVMEARQKKAGAYITGSAMFFGGVMLTVFSSFATVHNYRYTMPFCVIFTLFLAVGTGFLLQKAEFGTVGRKNAVTAAVFSIFLLFNVFTIAANVINFGRDCRDIRAQSISAGRWLKEHIKDDEFVAINDAGAITYFSGKRVFDLVGLVTNGEAKIFQNGKAGVFEELEHIRPRYFLVHVGWFNYEPYTIFKKPRLTEFNIKREPAYFVVGSPEVCVETDMSLFGSGDTMKDEHLEHGTYAIKDALDVCDLRDETKHKYRIWAKRVSEYPGNLLEEDFNNGDPKAPRILDAGRITSGGEEFTVTGLTPGADMKIVRRTFETPEVRLAVYIGGRKAGEWLTPEKKSYTETEFPVKGEFITSNTEKVRLEVITRNRYNAFYYWFMQKERDK